MIVWVWNWAWKRECGLFKKAMEKFGLPPNYVYDGNFLLNELINLRMRFELL